jgi:glyoxylase-like metal-dependent hydrolase (beta-lactamase superfamily II)
MIVSGENYPFQLGSFECLALSDGSWDYPIRNLFANVRADRVKEALRRNNLPIDYVTTPYTFLCINTGEQQVLVDMGAGDRLAPRTGKLPHNLRASGIEPSEIDSVIITHAHPDHVGGALDEVGQPRYAKADYTISRSEWEFWLSEASAAKAPRRFVDVARRNLGPLRDRLTLVEGEADIVPGIRVIPAPGHTPGHLVVEVTSGKALLLYISDTVVHPLHLEHPTWQPIYDLEPESAAISKRRIFDRAAAENALVMGQHLPPFPSLGTVVKHGRGWKWQPI